MIVKSLDLKNNQVIFDLGAGDGKVIFEAAKEAYKKKFKTKFIAVEINPILILVLNLRRFFHLNIKNIKIIQADFFKTSLRALAKQSHYCEIAELVPSYNSERLLHSVRNDSEGSTAPRNDSKAMKQFNNVTIYLYISPWFLDKVAKKILQEFPNAKIVSYMYPIKSLKKKEKVINGKKSIFVY